MATAMCTCASLGLRSKYVGVVRHRRERPPHPRRADQAATSTSPISIIRDAENQFAVILVDETTGERIVLWDRDDRLRLARARAADRRAGRRPRRPRGRRRRRRGDPGGADRARRRRDGDERHRSADAADRGAGQRRHARHLRAARAGAPHRHERHRSRRCGCCASGTTTCCASRWASTARWRSTATASTTSRRSTSTRVDTTGAGDVFRGGFIYALVNGQPMDQALRTANAAAAVSCTRLGALNGVPTLDEVNALIASRKVSV